MDCKFQTERKYETIEVHYIVQNFLTTYYKLKWDSKHTSLNESEALSSTYISGINPDLPKEGFSRFGGELKKMS